MQAQNPNMFCSPVTKISSTFHYGSLLSKIISGTKFAA